MSEGSSEESGTDEKGEGLTTDVVEPFWFSELLVNKPGALLAVALPPRHRMCLLVYDIRVTLLLVLAALRRAGCGRVGFLCLLLDRSDPSLRSP